MGLLQTREARVAIALAIGLLIGTERERRREEQGTGFAGLRTFTLTALLGGLLGYAASLPLIVAGGVVVGMFAVAAYLVHRADPAPGITTEVALVVTYVLGFLAIEHPVMAPGVAVVMTWILALRGELHALVLKSISERELRDALLFLLVALVVLPMAPDAAFGPYGAINPQSLVRLILVLMTVTSAGYIAQRFIRPRLGLALTGFVAGFVSSSATIAAMSLRAKESPSEWRAAASAGLASSVATVVQYAVVVAAVNPELLVFMLPSLGCAGLMALVITGLFAWLALRDGGTQTNLGRPFHLLAAIGFAGIFVLVTIASSALQEQIGRAGIVLVSAVAAFADAQSTAGSVASLQRAGSIDAKTAELAIITALSTNTITKLVMAWSGRHVRYGAALTLGVLCIAAAAWAGLILG